MIILAIILSLLALASLLFVICALILNKEEKNE